MPRFLNLATSIAQPRHDEAVRRALDSILRGAAPLLVAGDDLVRLEALDKGLYALTAHQSGARTQPVRVVLDDRAFRVSTRMILRGVTSHTGQPGHLHSYLTHHRILPESHRGIQLSIDPVESTSSGRIARRLTQAEPLRVYVGCFEDAAQLSYQPVGGTGLRYTGLENEAERWGSVEAALDEAKALTADIVVFAELSLTLALRRRVKRWLRDQREDPPFLLVLPGSFHGTPEAGDLRPDLPETQLPIHSAELLDHRGGQVLRHCKLIPTRGEKITTGHRVKMLETPVGAIAVAICRDFCEEDADFSDLWELLSPEWVLVPSLTSPSGMRAHVKRAGQQERVGPCVIAIANSPTPGQWREGELKHGFVLSPKQTLQEASPGEPSVEIDFAHLLEAEEQTGNKDS